MSLEMLAVTFLIRVCWALGIAAFGLSVYLLVNRLVLAHARNQATGLDSVRPGEPVLLYFTTPTCAPCKTIQKPAIQKLQEQVGGKLQVIEIDAAARPEVASRWGVLTVPTTFIIGAHGHPRHVNHGVTSADKLLKQVNEVAS